METATVQARASYVRIPNYLFLEIAKQEGVGIEEKKAWTKLEASPGRNVYVPRTEMVSRVDISGFLMGGPGYVDLGNKSFGNVHVKLQFSGRTQEQVLGAFRAALIRGKQLGSRFEIPEQENEIPVLGEEPKAAKPERRARQH
jgi:hypothetical protein